MQNKKLIVLFVVFSFLGGFLGSLLVSSKAEANIFEDIFNVFKKPLFETSKNQEEKISTSSPEKDKQVSKYQTYYDYERAIIDVAKKSSPAVISIVISKNLPIIEQCPQSFSPFNNLPPEFRDFFGDGFGEFRFYAPCQRGTTTKEVGGGSGFIVSSDGLIVTNKHVVSDSNAEYTVLLNDGRKFKAKILAKDPIQDIAIIKINVSNLPVLNLGNSDELELGQTVIAIGNALGEFRNTVSVGVVSGLSRNIVAQGSNFGPEKITGVIQTDAAINLGNSGGPLLNLKGEVIGINTAIVSGAQNIGFAIPVNQIKKDIESVKTTGKIITPYLGVRYILITPEIAKEQKLKSEYGALLRGDSSGPAVEPNSPAAKAGLLAEDIILEVNDVKVNEDNNLTSLIGRYKVGDKVTLKILRNGNPLNLEVVLGERPQK